MMAAWAVLSAAQAGIKDKYALAAIAAATTAAYSISTPPTEAEAAIIIDPGRLLGGDGKLFWWDIPFMEGM
jgi:hypothetical protein